MAAARSLKHMSPDHVQFQNLHYMHYSCFNEQVMWLVVTEVQNESFGLVTEHHYDTLMLCAVSHICAYWMSSVSVMQVIFFTFECGIAHLLCTMRVFDVRASSSPPRLLLCQISLLSRLPLLC